MYFAVERTQRDVAYQLGKEISGSASLKWMALIDGAFDYGQQQAEWQQNAIPLYKRGGTLQDLSEASPYLIQLDPHSPSLLSSLRVLLAHCSGRPMLSFIASHAAPQKLCDSWQDCLWATLDTEAPYLLRFADTRVLPVLAEFLAPATWARLAEGVQSWHIVDRSGSLESMPCGTGVASLSGRIQLSQEELGNLLHATLPDTVIEVVHQNMPDLLHQRKPSELHKRARLICDLASKHDADALPDIVALMTFELVTGWDVAEEPKIGALLRSRAWRRGSLIEKLDELVE
ncbi:DUF4123 domain-containing protein [Cupriavidus gilardii]|uniref:DUF4123 domain-containing protein n=1 Tax=Cupriavidus gilardii TaxID=82541 RepID=UPI0009ECECD9|nr:DUF4123 domain-containing protein [Cupriavidus gilardii]